MTTASPSSTMNPHYRIQVLFENEPGAPTKEFKACDLAEPTFDALADHIFRMTSIKDSLDNYNVTFKYQMEERHGSRFVHFDSTKGLGYAIQSNQQRGYVFISASILKKGTVAPPLTVSSAAKAAMKPKAAKKSRATKPKAPSRKTSTGEKVPVEHLILSSLKELLDLGITAPPRLQVAVFSGYSCLQSKGYVRAMKELKTKGYIEYPDSKSVCLTQAGIAKAPSATAAAMNNEQVQQRFKGMLKDKAPEVFEVLKDGRAHDREQVAAAVGYSCLQSKGFVKALKQIKGLNLIEYPKDGKKKLVQLSGLAFPFGRPRESSSMSVVSNDDASDI